MSPRGPSARHSPRSSRVSRKTVPQSTTTTIQHCRDLYIVGVVRIASPLTPRWTDRIRSHRRAAAAGRREASKRVTCGHHHSARPSDAHTSGGLVAQGTSPQQETPPTCRVFLALLCKSSGQVA